MKVIKVAKDFVLTLDDHTVRAFTRGVYEVEDYVAEHWYVQAHLAPIASNPASYAIHAEETFDPPVVDSLAPVFVASDEPELEPQTKKKK